MLACSFLRTQQLESSGLVFEGEVQYSQFTKRTYLFINFGAEILLIDAVSVLLNVFRVSSWRNIFLW